MNYINKTKNIPNTEHYVILLEDSVTYDDGYGREGHESYSIKEYMSYLYFNNKEELSTWVLANKDKNYKAVSVKPLNVKITVNIDVDVG